MDVTKRGTPRQPFLTPEELYQRISSGWYGPVETGGNDLEWSLL